MDQETRLALIHQNDLNLNIIKRMNLGLCQAEL